MKVKFLIKLSMIIDKMGIKDQLVNVEMGNNEQVAKAVLSMLIANLYKAENEVYEFIAMYYECSKEEAQEKDAIAFFKELLKLEGLKDFLAQQ